MGHCTASSIISGPAAAPCCCHSKQYGSSFDLCLACWCVRRSTATVAVVPVDAAYKYAVGGADGTHDDAMQRLAPRLRLYNNVVASETLSRCMRFTDTSAADMNCCAVLPCLGADAAACLEPVSAACSLSWWGQPAVFSRDDRSRRMAD